MRTWLVRGIVALSLPIAVCSCTLFGSGTQVRFQSSASFTLAAIQFGSVLDSTPLASGSITSYYSIAPGQSVLTAQDQITGTWSNAILLTVVAGHSYTVAFAGSTFVSMSATFSADN